MSKRIIIPKGLVNPNETTVIEIPANLEMEQELIAAPAPCQGSQFDRCSVNRTINVPQSPSFGTPPATSTPRDSFTYSTLEDPSVVLQRLLDSPERTLSTTDGSCPGNLTNSFDGSSLATSRSVSPRNRTRSIHPGATFGALPDMGATQSICPGSTFNTSPRSMQNRTFNMSRNLGQTFDAPRSLGQTFDYSPPSRTRRTMNIPSSLGGPQLLSRPCANATYQGPIRGRTSPSFNVPLATSTPADTFTYSSLYESGSCSPYTTSSGSYSTSLPRRSSRSKLRGSKTKNCPFTCSRNNTRNLTNQGYETFEGSQTGNLYKSSDIASYGSLSSLSERVLEPYKDIGRTRSEGRTPSTQLGGCPFGVLGSAYLTASRTPSPRVSKSDGNQSIVEDIQSELHEIENTERIQLEEDLRSYQQARRTLMSNTAFTFGERSTNISQITSGGSSKCRSSSPSPNCQ